MKENSQRPQCFQLDTWKLYFRHSVCFVMLGDVPRDALERELPHQHPTHFWRTALAFQKPSLIWSILPSFKTDDFLMLNVNKRLRADAQWGTGADIASCVAGFGLGKKSKYVTLTLSCKIISRNDAQKCLLNNYDFLEWVVFSWISCLL